MLTQEIKSGADQIVSKRSLTAIVGKKLKNPYSVRNMRTAQENLSKRGLNWYVKFKPVSSDEVQQLMEDSLKLFDFPLDHELFALPDTMTMDYSLYRDGQIPNLYTVVHEDYDFKAVEYEILDTLVFPTAQQEELDYEAHLLTGNVDSSLLISGGRSKLFGVGTKPSGFIRLTDSQR